MHENILKRGLGFVLAMVMVLSSMVVMALPATAAGNAPSTSVDEIDTSLPEGVKAWDGKAATSFAGGTGTPEDPYLIATPGQLQLFISNVVNERKTYNNDKKANEAAAKEAAYQEYKAANFAAAYAEALLANPELTEEEFETTFKAGFTYTYPAFVPVWGAASYKMVADLYLNDDFTTAEHGKGEGNLPTNVTVKGVKGVPCIGYGDNWGTAQMICPFYGTFDGDGYAIYNPYYRHDYFVTGLFGELHGTVKNLNILGGYYNMNGNRGATSAVLASYVGKDGSVINCHVRTYMYAPRDAAGLFGSVSGTARIVDCSFGGKVYATNGTFGGIACYANDYANFQGCVNYAEFHATGSAKIAGGIVGHVVHPSVSVSSCTNYGDFFAEGTTFSDRYGVGGIVGYCRGYVINAVQDFTLVDCVNHGTIKAAKVPAGGLLGAIVTFDSWDSNDHSGTRPRATLYLTNCSNYGDVTSGAEGSTDNIMAGGLVGLCRRGLIASNSFNFGDVTANATNGRAGGIAGTLTGCLNNDGYTGVKFTNVANYGNVTSGLCAGGIAGRYESASSKDFNGFYLNSYVNTGVISAPYVAHLAGYAHIVDNISRSHVDISNSILASQLVCTGSAEASNYYPAVLIGYISRALSMYVTVSANAYINDNGLTTLMTMVDTPKTAADYADYAPSAHSATALVDGTYTALLNANTGETGVLWYQSSKLGAPAPVTNLKVSQASVSVGTTPAIAVLLSGVSGLPSDAEIQLVNSTGRAVAATKVDGSRYRFDFAVELADIGLTDTYHLMVNGQKSVHSYELSVAGLLGSLYAKATEAEKNLMVAMVNYSYYAGNASAFDVFNAVAGTAFAPSVEGAEAIADAGSVSIESGYEVALSIEKGFVIIVTKDGEEIDQHTKSVLNATDIVNLGSAGSVSVAAMLNHYLGDPAHADLAKAAILFYEAAVAAQDAAALAH